MGIAMERGQATILRPATLSGVGVHSGKPVRLTIHPGAPGSGIVFSSAAGVGRDVRAESANVCSTALCTAIGSEAFRVSTVEHLMAALAGLEIDNAAIEVDGPEIPIFDGSALPIVEALVAAGIRRRRTARAFLRVLRPVRVENGDGFAEFLPFEGRRFDVSITYDCPAIRSQRIVWDFGRARFVREVARARTFGFLSDVERLWSAGLALGASLDNAVVIDDGRVMNLGGLRFSDEFVRHKLLDAIGDTALLGLPFLGTFRSHKGGHALNDQAVKALLAERAAFEIVRGSRVSVPQAEEIRPRLRVAA